MRADAPQAGVAAPAVALAVRPGWPVIKRVAIGLYFVAIAWLLTHHARAVDWHAVAAAVRSHTAWSLLPAAGLAAVSYGLYTCYDLIGRRQVGHALRAAQVLATAFVSYAFNLNFGALVGGVALRYRLYSRLGLAGATITQVLALSMLTNWLGYVLLAGGVLLLGPPALAQAWPLGHGSAQAIGVLLLALVAAYLLLCFSARKRVWNLRGHDVRLPSGPLALLQLALSTANWLTIAGVVAVLLQGRLDYTAVLGALLAAAVAGVVTHVPAGLGVLEAVFVALLSHRVPAAELLGALLTYRAVYYLAPLGLALATYLSMEARAGREARADKAGLRDSRLPL